jgi:ferrochelatase
MAHGTPSSMDDMPEYLRLVRGGRLASPELVAEMRHNYEAIGGRSPLTDLTLAQADALRRALGSDVPVAVGMRNWQPFIKDALADLASRGVTRVIGIPLAPQFSTLSVAKYFDAANRSIPSGVTLVAIDSFHSHPLLLEAFAERIRAAGPAPGTARNEPGDAETVVFTAHSLPARVIQAGDRYADEVQETAQGVARRAGVAGYLVAYQSAGRTPEPWIGPEVGDLVKERAIGGVRRFLIVPIGFVCDHTEILFDIDVQAKNAAASAGASLRRTESLNTSPTFIAVLEDLVRQHL